MNILLVNASGSTIGDDAISDMIKIWLVDLKCYVQHFLPPPNKLFHIKASRMIIGGAGILYDDPKANYWHTNHYTGYLNWAKQNKIKACGISLGWQGIHTTYGRNKWRDALNTLDFITTRDPHTQKYLEEMGVNRRIIALQDIAVCLPVTPTTPKTHDISVGLHHPIVTANDFKYKDYAGLEAKYREFFSKLSKYSMHFFAFSSWKGLDRYREFMPRNSTLTYASPLKTLKMMSGGKIAVTTNLHGLVFAVACWLPTYALCLGEKNKKINWFIQSLGLPCYDNILNMNPDKVVKLLEKPYDPQPYWVRAYNKASQNKQLLRIWLGK